MYLLNASEVSTILTSNQSQGTVCGTAPLDRFMGVLLLCGSRVEELCELQTLSRTRVTDTFYSGRNDTYGLCLSGGFLPEDHDMIIEGPSGEVIEAPTVLNRELGVVHMPLQRGVYRVTYTQGFETDINLVYQDVPEFLKSIAKYVVLYHYRLTTLANNSPENVSFHDLAQETRREMWARISKRYAKPRYGVLQPIEGGMGG